ncbi:GbsR/MarR family transcriptional regulator [Oleiharenicola sp. Vm1]|uniref:GbsR/MarR family transcriptional regulator n=1 Tax=Oleiharenicola sp. Vm1 TaxID=3398393 RepID=UPI0039F4491C
MDFFVDAAELLGVPKSVAAIYGVVFASPHPLSFAEIQGRLDLSKGSVSQGLRLLREIGALKEVSSLTDRASLFEPDMEIRKIISHFVEHRVRKQLDTGRDRLVALSAQVPTGTPAGKILRERLKHLQGTHEKARALLPVAKTFLNLGR